MTHALADAAESKTPSSSERSRKFMNVTVYFLDDSSHVFQLQAKNLGQVLLDKVCKFINLVEVDYFGLEFEDDKKAKCWLDALKPLCSQISTSFPTMYFCVKFYTPDPVQLEDEFTRYLFGLQVKKDLANGFMQCNDNTSAVMVSYIVQADFGDFNPEKCEDGSYLSAYKFVPLQDTELECKVLENHKRLTGQTPAEADLNLLETARRCELYGIKMTAAKDHEGVPLNLAVAHLGVLVFQNYTKINTFSWAKIRKLSFKRKKFLIKLHPEGYGYYKDTVEFFFDGRNECKNFWKKCIENHTFFRCTDAKHGMRQRPKIFSRGSSFRYSGRTQKQVSEYVRENGIKRPPFQRSTSLRTPSSPSRSIGSSVSPQPLLPVTSLSCGSISDTCKDTPKQGGMSPNAQGTPAVTPGEDSRDDITYDNLSHDSYDVLERESEDTNCMPATNSRPNTADTVEDPKNDCIDANPKDIPRTRSNSEGVLKDETNSKDAPRSRTNSEDAPRDETNSNCMPTNTSSEVNSVAIPDDDHKKLEELENNNNTTMQTTEEKIMNDIKELNASNDSRRLMNRMEPFDDDEGNRLSGEAHFEENSVSSINITSNDYENCNVLHDSQQNFGTSTFYISSPYAVRLANKRKSLTDKTYCLAKELLMTERTYRKDLEIVNVVFREEFYSQVAVQSAAVDRILGLVDPLYERHCSLLRDLEQRLAFWEGRPSNRNSSGTRGVADILFLHKAMTEIHSHYLDNLSSALELLYIELSENSDFATVYRHFESQKVCYLPLTSFLLRATFRIPYYAALLKDLLGCCNTQHENYNACVDMLAELKTPCENFDQRILPLVNFVKLMELQRSLIGFPNLVDKEREFIREGSLFKLTRNGSQQHMFFLFSDTLLWATRVHGGHLLFRVRGRLPSRDLCVEHVDPMQGVSHCLSLSATQRTLVVGAPSERELNLWLEDLKREILNGGEDLSEDKETEDEEYEEVEEVIGEEEKVTHVNTSMHICWHRNISVSCQDLLLSMKHSMSGYLLRKFRNSSGWQKVWVVLANLCLFFYRSYLEESPLASLPLAGYRITRTSSTDLVHGELVFKLLFKNHEYFFTVENKHTFDRWMEAVGICTLTQEENTRL